MSSTGFVFLCCFVCVLMAKRDRDREHSRFFGVGLVRQDKMPYKIEKGTPPPLLRGDAPMRAEEARTGFYFSLPIADRFP